MGETWQSSEPKPGSKTPNDLVISSGEAARPGFRHDQMNEKDDEITHPGMLANPKKTVIFGPIHHRE